MGVSFALHRRRTLTGTRANDLTFEHLKGIIRNKTANGADLIDNEKVRDLFSWRNVWPTYLTMCRYHFNVFIFYSFSRFYPTDKVVGTTRDFSFGAFS